MKSAQRADENDNYKHLARNLRLLHIKATPEILKLARENHARRLRLYAPHHCR